jgi:CHAT domain-containing protein
MAQRLASRGDTTLARLIRQRQDILGQLNALEKPLIDTYGQVTNPSQSQRRAEGIRHLITQLRERLEQVTQELYRAFPDFVEFEGSQLVELNQLQQALKPDEAALAWVLGEKESYLLLIPQQGQPKLHRLQIGQKQVDQLVHLLHRTLDLGDPSHRGKLAPFPAAQSAELFSQLFGPNWEADLKGVNHLLLVPEGPLTRLPFAALLTQKTQEAQFPLQGPHYEKAPWLAKRFALSVLPTLSAITALRDSGEVNATEPFLGIGDPLLDDHPAKTRNTALSKDNGSDNLYRDLRGLPRISQQLETETDLHQSRLQLIRKQPSLPDTADELQAIAELMQSSKIQPLMLREQATETRIKLSPLNRYQILSFATHGVLAGDLGKGAEPGLILTPPQTATLADDGFLSLSEVAQLELDADWVVLSACNTAGGSSSEEEGLTGLAKAFIYAGSKTLLVSHWSVSSVGTVDLMWRLFRNYKQQDFSKAQAHQQAMLEMINSGDLRAHPSFWAPFIIYGEGG